jgi:formate hydrogenlyase subunit 6/NADH:ubiquinone oxidoreductase subunit I
MVRMFPNILRNLRRKPATRRYPSEKREAPAGTRGHLDIEIEKCVFCGVCQKRCPANALAVSRAPKSWSVNPYACIICGYCVEACPKKCLVMRREPFRPS